MLLWVLTLEFVLRLYKKKPGLGYNMIRLSDQSETSSDMADPCQETVMGRGEEGWWWGWGQGHWNHQSVSQGGGEGVGARSRVC